MELKKLITQARHNGENVGLEGFQPHGIEPDKQITFIAKQYSP